MNVFGYEIEKRGLLSRPHLNHQLMTKDGLYNLGLYHVLNNFLEGKEMNEENDTKEVYDKREIKHLVRVLKNYQEEDVGLLYVSSHSKDSDMLFKELKEKYEDIFYRDKYLHETYDNQNVLIIIKDVNKHITKINHDIYHDGMLTLLTVDSLKVYVDNEVVHDEAIENDNTLYIWADKLGSNLRELKMAHTIIQVSKKNINHEIYLLSKLDSKLMKSIPNRFRHTDDLPVSHLKMRRYQMKPLKLVFSVLLSQKHRDTYFDMTLDMYIAFHMRRKWTYV